MSKYKRQAAPAHVVKQGGGEKRGEGARLATTEEYGNDF